MGPSAAPESSVLGGLDASWLLLEAETTFEAGVGFTMQFGEGMTRDKLRAALLEQAEAFPRYRSILHNDWARFHGPRFVVSADFDVDNHLTTETLPAPAGRDEFERRVGDFFARPFDFSRPLWEVCLVTNLNLGEAKSALIARSHHALADGQARAVMTMLLTPQGFVASQLFMTSYRDELRQRMDKQASERRMKNAVPSTPSKAHPKLAKLDWTSDQPLLQPLVLALLLVTWLLKKALHLAEQLVWAAIHIASSGHFLIWTSWLQQGCLKATYTPGPRTDQRQYASSQPFALSDVKTCQKAFSTRRGGHVTLNDVVIACLADAVRPSIEAGQPRPGWFRSIVRRIAPRRVSFFIPISHRPSGDWTMRNYSTGATVFLTPHVEGEVTLDSLRKHVYEAKREMRIIKNSRLPLSLRNGLELGKHFPAVYRPISVLPSAIARPLAQYIYRPMFELIMQSFMGVATNVPGPPEPVELCGCKVLSWTVLPPSGARDSLALGIISYAGKLSVSVMADAPPGSHGVARRIVDEFETRFSEYIRIAQTAL